MKLVKLILFSIAALLTAAQVWAVSGPGVGSSSIKPLTSAYEPVSRGGMITAVNQEKRTISVDGVSYPISYDNVAIHSDGPAVSKNIFRLEQGTRIRFNTKRDSSGQDRIIEIWVANHVGETAQ